MGLKTKGRDIGKRQVIKHIVVKQRQQKYRFADIYNLAKTKIPSGYLGKMGTFKNTTLLQKVMI
jgi:hypothetical protein